MTALPKFFYDNRLLDAAVSASSTATGNYAPANVNDMRPYTWWQGSAMPANLTVNCGSAKAANYALVYGHDLFTQGATCEVRGSTDNFASSNNLVASNTPADNNPFLIEFGSVSYQYWRLNFTGSTNPSIAIALIGTEFVMPVGLPFGFDPIGRMASLQANNNENGQPLGKVIDFEQWSQTLKFAGVTQSWMRSTFLPAWKSNLRGQPFVFGWDTGDYPAEIYLCSAGTGSVSGGSGAPGFTAVHDLPTTGDLVFDINGVMAP